MHPLLSCPAAAMLLWGWRVPFLMSIVTLAVAAILRYNMPESSEFTMSREELSEEAIKRARQANAHGVEAGSSAAGSTDGHISVIDVEGQTAAAAADEKKAHYVPVLELFRGYWSGLVLHSLYGACKSLGFIVMLQYCLSRRFCTRLAAASLTSPCRSTPTCIMCCCA
jgi:hypothetical protein